MAVGVQWEGGDDSMIACDDALLIKLANFRDQLLSHLIGDLSEVGLDEDGLSSLYELTATGRKSKSASNMVSRKRAKFSKSPIVSS